MIFRAKKTPQPAPVIAVQLNGGLGNQLFQYAAARSLALRVGSDLWFDLTAVNADRLRSFQLPGFKTVGRVVQPSELAAANLARYDEPFYHFDDAFESIKPGTLLVGYFQSERYFKEHSARICAEIELAAPVSSAFASYEKQIAASTLPISVHVRRGDMAEDPKTAEFHGVCGSDYYIRALRIIEALAGASPTYFVFSDDRRAAAEIFAARKNFALVETDPNRPGEDMTLMSLCRHHVLANSSFSWWGAWRDRRPDKIVVAPRFWVAPKTLRKLNTADLHPDGTILI